jgi:hypothetical protein
MDQTPLVKEDIEAGSRLIREFNHYQPVAAAFWLKRVDDYRYLYIASRELRDRSVREPYGEILRLVRELELPLDPFGVKLVADDDAFARDAIETYRRFPEAAGMRPSGSVLGGTWVDDFYLYPLPTIVPLPPTQLPGSQGSSPVPT